MLVISRKVDETIRFPELDIEVRVIKSGPSHVRVGINAPKDVSIMRGELLEKAATRERKRQKPPGKIRRALLVDDSQNESKLLASYLQLRNIEVDIAYHGARALELLEAGPTPDVVLLDMQMPEFDGAWTVNQLRADPDFCDLRIIAVTGFDPRELGVSIGPRGVDAWFPKPLNPAQLIDQLNHQATPVMAS